MDKVTTNAVINNCECCLAKFDHEGSIPEVIVKLSFDHLLGKAQTRRRQIGGEHFGEPVLLDTGLQQQRSRFLRPRSDDGCGERRFAQSTGMIKPFSKYR